MRRQHFHDIRRPPLRSKSPLGYHDRPTDRARDDRSSKSARQGRGEASNQTEIRGAQAARRHVIEGQRARPIEGDNRRSAVRGHMRLDGRKIASDVVVEADRVLFRGELLDRHIPEAPA